MKNINKYCCLTVAAVLLLFSSCSKQKELSFNEVSKANDYLMKLYPELKGWREEVDFVRPDLFVKPGKDGKGELIYICDDNDTVRIAYNAGSNNNVKVIVDSAAIGDFKNFLNEKLGLTEENSKKQDVDSLAKQIGVSTSDEYIKSIVDAKQEWHNTVLSLLYNTCVGDPDRHIGVAVKDNKLVMIRENDFPVTYLDTAKFFNFVKTCDTISSPKMFRKLLEDSLIVRTIEKPVFTYWDVRKDKLFFGESEHNLTVNTEIQSLADSLKSVVGSIWESPADVTVWLNAKAMSLYAAVPELTTMVPFSINETCFKSDKWSQPETSKETTEETKIEDSAAKIEKTFRQSIDDLPFWVMLMTGLGLGLLMSAVVWIILFKLIKRKIEEKEDMNKDKLVNRHANEIAKLFREVDKEKGLSDEETQRLYDLQEELKNLCPGSFVNFSDSSDVEEWLERYNFSEDEEERKRNDTPCLVGLDEESTIDEILKNFDKTFSTKHFEDLKETRDRLKKYECSVKEFKKIISSETEKDLLAALKELKKKYNSLPEILSISSVYENANKDKKTVVIMDILRAVDSHYKTTFESYFKLCNEKARQCNHSAKLLDIQENANLSEYLKGIISEYESSERSVVDAANFIARFKTEDGKVLDTSKLKAINATIDRFSSLIDGINQKKEFSYWDKLAIIILSISECAIPLMKAMGKDKNLEAQQAQMILTIKNDLLLTYVTRHFLNAVQDSKVSASEFFANTTVALEKAVAGYNNGLGIKCPDAVINLEKTEVNDRLKVLEASIGKVRSYEDMIIFTDKMWDNFVSDFLAKAPECNKSYIMQQTLNIAYHTADFLDHIKRGRDVEYCYNFAYLLNDFNKQETGCKEFEHHNYSKSTTYSDAVYEIAEQFGVSNLKILVDNYLIKP